MSGYLFSEEIYEVGLNDFIPIVEITKLLREERELNTIIGSTFPLSSLGSETNIRVEGAKSLLAAFERVDGEKSDLVERLENIEFIGVSHEEQIILHFKNEEVSAAGVYDFTYEFLDETFYMGKYGRYCIHNGYNDLLKSNLDRLFLENKQLERQYRFISKDGDLYLRGFTSSNRYQNYDNNVALYIFLFYLHKAALVNDVQFRITRARVSDSAIRVFIEEIEPIVIPKVGKVYSGLVLSNSEVRDNALTLEVRYRLVDENNSQASFAIIPDLQDSVFNIRHTYGMDRLKEKINDVNKLRQSQQAMKDLITGLKEMKKISNEALYYLYTQIIHNNNFQSGTKTRFKELYNNNIVNNTLSLIQAFDKTNSITSDVDERVYLEKIYFDLINDIVSRSRN